MDLLNRLSAKQLILIVLIGGFLIYNLDSKSFVIDFFYSLNDRFNIKKKLNEIDVNSDSNSDSNIDTKSAGSTSSDIKELNEMREDIYKAPSSKDEDSFCNLNKGRRSTQFEEMYQCLLNNSPGTKDVLIPTNVIPYNFDNNKDNNVLYSISPQYAQSKINYEKSLTGGVTAVNNKILHSNFDKDIDYYKIGRRRDTILNLSDGKTHCNITDLTKFQDKIKLFTRKLDKNVVINWNIPILPFGYIPQEVFFVISRYGDLSKKKNADSADIYTIPFLKKPCEFEGDGFKIKSLVLGNRISYTFKSELEEWYNSSKKCYKLSSRVYFLFKYYDNEKTPRDCVMESNVSNLY